MVFLEFLDIPQPLRALEEALVYSLEFAQSLFKSAITSFIWLERQTIENERNALR